jgi:hypothetical protein
MRSQTVAMGSSIQTKSATMGIAGMVTVVIIFARRKSNSPVVAMVAWIRERTAMMGMVSMTMIAATTVVVMTQMVVGAVVPQ